MSAVAGPPGERYIVQFQDGRGAEGLAAVTNAGTIARDLARHNAVAAYIPGAAVAGLQRNPNIDFVELDARRYLYSHLTTSQEVPYGITQVQIGSLTETDARTICVIDSGYDYGHPDLPQANVSGTDDGGTGSWMVDGSGHGTHVAGTIAALNNSEGVVGVVPGTPVGLHIVKVFGDDGTWGYSSDLIAALGVCEAAGANVVSMSLGGSFKSRAEQRAFDDAYREGVLSVAAAGNDGNTRKSFPASYDSVVSVAAIDDSKAVASFSQRNDQVELAAAGVGVLSTVPRGSGLESSASAGGTDYESVAMDGSPYSAGATGPLTDCGLGTSACPGGGGQVCLIQRGDITFAEKVVACQDGGGVAAIIYNNVPGMLYGTLGETVTTIPSVGTSDADGAAMNGQLGDSATVAIEASDYAAWDGTSMATPHVSGVAALVWSNHVACTNEDIRNALNATAEDLDPPGRDVASGYGLVQATSAADYLLNGCGGGDEGGGGNSCELLEVGASCTANDQCCSNKCKGPQGRKTCK